MDMSDCGIVRAQVGADGAGAGGRGSDHELRDLPQIRVLVLTERAAKKRLKRGAKRD